MYWYNPKTRITESRDTPRTDAEALFVLGGNLNSGSFAAVYEGLRASGMSVEQALIFTGHEFRLKHLEFRAAR